MGIISKIKIIGTKTVINNLRRRIQKMERASSSGVYEAAEYVMEQSKRLCPYGIGYGKSSEGHLVDTAFIVSGLGETEVDAPLVETLRGGGAFATFGYKAPWALVTHENERTGKTGGESPSGRKYTYWSPTGQWQFLRQPLYASSKTVLNIIKNRVRV